MYIPTNYASSRAHFTASSLWSKNIESIADKTWQQNTNWNIRSSKRTWSKPHKSEPLFPFWSSTSTFAPSWLHTGLVVLWLCFDCVLAFFFTGRSKGREAEDWIDDDGGGKSAGLPSWSPVQSPGPDHVNKDNVSSRLSHQ